MAEARLMFDGKINEPDTYEIVGKITCSDSAISSATSAGKFVTYTSDGAGVYTLAFADKFYSCVYAEANVIGDNADAAWVTSVTPTSAAAVISVGTTKGTPADIGAETVYFRFVFKKTAV